MTRLEMPLIGLLEEILLPGEEQSFAPPVVAPPTIAAIAAQQAQKPGRLAAVTIAATVELPSLVTARWATECEVVAAEGEKLVLRGVGRVRIRAARGRESPYTAEIEPSGDAPVGTGAETAALVSSAHALFETIDAGAQPENLEWQTELRALMPRLLRTVASGEQLRDSLRLPPAEALRQLAQTLAARSQGEQAACTLEAMLREIADKPELSTALKHRLWAQVVEIQKRLDVYDPAVQPQEGDDVGRLQRRLMQSGLPKAAREMAKRELRLLRSMQSNHHDYSSYVAHLDFMARLPWHPEPLPAMDLGAVRAALDREHAGLEKAKRRVLEYLAVRALGGDAASTVLCLAGPPGVGKTTIARAIAGALGRKFVRIPLGGVHDECEIRGHRITFTAAAPGRILSGLARAGSSAAVVLLDEIDKIGKDRQRSPAAALLEVLDPEQNPHFQDNYLGTPYDLSHVLFICTANDLDEINEVLRDRLECIELEGYTVREKIEIALNHLLPRMQASHGLPEALQVEEPALRLLIEGYTREAGVRQLQRALAAIHRRRALALCEGKSEVESGASPQPPRGSSITAEEVQGVLGTSRHFVQVLPASLPVGVSTGLSVGPDGGAILFIEVGGMPGRGELRLTGRLGEVMRESAHTALAHLRMDPGRYGVAADRLGGDFHVHVPEGATPKEGPSAGTALFCAFLSWATGIPLRSDVALSGEITLSGRVLPVGGVRAKVLAAERAGVRRVVLPEENRGDVPEDARVEMVFVREIKELVPLVFTQVPAPVQPSRDGRPSVERRSHAHSDPGSSDG